MIVSFDGEHRFLSNFYRSPFYWRGKLWPTVEHAYQAAKCIHLADAEKIRRCEWPGRARQLGRQVACIPNWDSKKLSVMEELLRLKFSIPELKQLLASTGDQELIEGNNWGDTFWGVCRGVGKNSLGKLLMAVRQEVT